MIEPEVASAAPVGAAKPAEEDTDEVVVVAVPVATAPAVVSSPNQPRPKPTKSPSTNQTKPSTAPKGVQRDISSFFSKPTPKPSTSQPPAKRRKSASSTQPTPATVSSPTGPKQVLEPIQLSSSPPVEQAPDDRDDVAGEVDPLDGMTAEEVQHALEEASSSAAASASAWSGMFKPRPVPRCPGHGEPAKMWTVNKPGLNKGRKFYLCAR